MPHKINRPNESVEKERKSVCKIGDANGHFNWSNDCKSKCSLTIGSLDFAYALE